MDPTKIIGITLLGISGVALIGLAVSSIKNSRSNSFGDSFDSVRNASFTDRQSTGAPRYEYTNTGNERESDDDTFYSATGDEPRGGKKTKNKNKNKTKTKTKKYNKNK